MNTADGGDEDSRSRKIVARTCAPDVSVDMNAATMSYNGMVGIRLMARE